jgi:hypothetical protein
MKQLFKSLLALLAATVPVFAATAPVLPTSHVGTYEALLFTGDEATGTPAGFVTLVSASTGKASGKLTTDENKTYPFTANFVYDAESNTATTNPAAITISRGSKLPALSLTLTLKNAGQTLELTLTQPSATNRVATSGVKITPRLKTSTDLWVGKYTLGFKPSSVASGPSGSSYASGVVDSVGTLKLVGKFADGNTFTASLLPDASRGYRIYINPLKRPGSYFAGKINLVARTVGTGFHVETAVDPAADFYWNKPAYASDKTYPGGFGPLKLLLTMEPWVVPAKGQTLAQLLGIMTPGGTFQFDFNTSILNFNLAQYLGTLPEKLTVDAKNALVPVFGDVYAPTSAAEWAKIWTGKVDPNTGIFTGSMTLTDLVDQDGATSVDSARVSSGYVQKALKIVRRKLAVQGVFFNVQDPLKPLSAGNFLVPPLNSKIETNLYGAIDVPSALEPLGAGGPALNGLVSPGTPGTYEISSFTRIDGFDWSKFPVTNGVGVTVTGTMKGLPNNGAKATFVISPDLSTLTLNGRKVPLVGDSRPVALVYSDASSSTVKNNLTVVVYLNTTTGQASGMFANYIQYLSAKYLLFGRTFSSYAPGVALYVPENQPTPVKVK